VEPSGRRAGRARDEHLLDAIGSGAVSSARDVDRWMRAVFGGKVVPPKQQQEWTELVSTKTGEPIARVSADDPEGFALGLARRILGPLGAQWFYEGESLGYRTIYVWIADQDLMIKGTRQAITGDVRFTSNSGRAASPLTESAKCQ
jgi:hypothetical protein